MVVETAEKDAPAETKPESCGKNGVSADEMVGIASARRPLRMFLMICIPCRSTAHAWLSDIFKISLHHLSALAGLRSTDNEKIQITAYYSTLTAIAEDSLDTLEVGCNQSKSSQHCTFGVAFTQHTHDECALTL